MIYFDPSGDLKELVQVLLKTLTLREECTVFEYYILGMTFKEIGIRHKISTERTRQIIAKGMRKLRHPKRLRIMADHGFALAIDEMVRIEKEKKEREEREKIRQILFSKEQKKQQEIYIPKIYFWMRPIHWFD